MQSYRFPCGSYANTNHPCSRTFAGVAASNNRADACANGLAATVCVRNYIQPVRSACLARILVGSLAHADSRVRRPGIWKRSFPRAQAPLQNRINNALIE